MTVLNAELPFLHRERQARLLELPSFSADRETELEFSKRTLPDPARHFCPRQLNKKEERDDSANQENPLCDRS
jgi:hypothetical protein